MFRNKKANSIEDQSRNLLIEYMSNLKSKCLKENPAIPYNELYDLLRERAYELLKAMWSMSYDSVTKDIQVCVDKQCTDRYYVMIRFNVNKWGCYELHREPPPQE